MLLKTIDINLEVFNKGFGSNFKESHSRAAHEHYHDLAKHHVHIDLL